MLEADWPEVGYLARLGQATRVGGDEFALILEATTGNQPDEAGFVTIATPRGRPGSARRSRAAKASRHNAAAS